MLTLRDIMTRDVVYVTPETPVTDIVSILSSETITGVPVVQRDRVVGVISASDIVEFAGRADALTEPQPSPWDDVDTELERELEAGMTQWEAEDAELAEQFDDSSADDVALYDECTAADLMTRKLCTLPSATPIDRAARHMVRNRVHRLLVIDDNELVGIVTSMDFLRVVAEGNLD